MVPDAEQPPTVATFGALLRGLLLGLRFAWSNLSQNRARVALAVIGVAIGIGSVSSMLLIGHSVETSLRASLDSLGADIVTLVVAEGAMQKKLPGGGIVSDQRPLAPAQFATALGLLSGMPEVQSVATMARISACHSSELAVDLELQHIDLGVQPLLALKLAAGRFLAPADATEPNVVLGSVALQRVRELVPGAGVGSLVPVCGRMMTVVGILEAHRGSEVVQGLRVNASMLLGRGAMQRIAGTRPPASILVRLRDHVSSKAAGDAMVARLLAVMPQASVVSSGAWQVSEMRREQVSLYTSFLAVLGGISLLVGSLGIANVMLASVAERRKEIGLRMSIGATRQDITLQFLVESALICLMGAALGMLLSIAVAGLALTLSGFELSLSAAVVLQSTGMAVLCGLVAGAYPAHRAAAVDPIASLQGGA